MDSFASKLEELLEALAKVEKWAGRAGSERQQELDGEVERLKAELNDMVVTKTWLYDFLTNTADDKGRGAGQ